MAIAEIYRFIQRQDDHLICTKSEVLGFSAESLSSVSRNTALVSFS